MPYVFFASPGDKHACPKSAACWSPAMPAIGTLASPSRALPRRRRTTRPRSAAPRAARRARAAGRRPSRRSGCRRAACATRCSRRCTCTRPPVSCHTSQLSIVPNASSPRARARPRARRRGRAASAPWCRRSRRRARGRSARRTSAPCPAARSSSQHRRGAAVLPDDRVVRSGWPVARSHSTVVSRWFVMPIAATSRAPMSACGQRFAQHAATASPRSRSGRARPSPAAERSA